MKLLKSFGLNFVLTCTALLVVLVSNAQTLCDATEVLAITATEMFGEEVSWEIVDADGVVVGTGSDFESYSASTQVLCLTDGCYTVHMFDSFGDGWNGAIVSFISGDAVLGTGTLLEGSAGSFSFGVNTDGCDEGQITFGCTDSTACNYDETATFDDQSCTYPGCTDPEALNFDETAGCDDDSCEYPQPCESNTVSIVMFDSFGDGWNDAYYTVSTEDGAVVAEGTMVEGEFEIQDICLEDGCYIIAVSSGIFPGEISWQAVIGDIILAEGGAPAISGFGLNVDGCVSTFGCTDADACNYNETANFDDDSCTYPGCTDPNALNFNPTAGCDDGSCELCEGGAILQLYICTWCLGSVSEFEIVDAEGNVVFFEGDLPDNSIVFFDICLEEGICYTVNMSNTESTGWCDGYYVISTADGYSISTGALEDDESFGQEFFSLDNSCPVPGCTDSEALNYNPEATEDDGSCEYPEPCDGTTVVVNMYDSFGDGWNGAEWSLVSSTSGVVASGTLEEGDFDYATACLSDGCYLFEISGGLFLGEISWEVVIGDEIVASGGAMDATVISVNSDCEAIAGCTDPNGCNYNSEAWIDDASCTYPGCIDPEALNYNAAAGCDDDSCEYPEPCDATSVTLNLYDTFGDGWNGATYTIIDENGNVAAQGSLAAGDFGIDSACLTDGCYIIEVGGGIFDTEIYWEIILGDELIASGYAGIYGFGINADGCELITGCTDETACNYDAEAEYDDGSCTYPGCTDPNAFNFDPFAGCDDGSCETCDEGVPAQLYLCTFCEASGVALEILDDSGEVIFFVDDLSDNSITYYNLCLSEGICYTVNMYNTDGTGWCNGYYSVSTDFGYTVSTGSLGEGDSFGQEFFSLDGSCPVYGCTDVTALNYDPNANEDDGSCEYAEPCEGTDVAIVMMDSFGDGWNGGSYYIVDAFFNTVATGTLETGEFEVDLLCLEDGCYFIGVEAGAFPGEVSWEVVIGDVVVASGGAYDGANFGVNADCELIQGCTDETACNYNADALIDDQSCTYPGCTDPEALNYDEAAGCDDESCVYPEPCDATSVILIFSTQIWSNEISFELTSMDGDVVLAEEGFEDNSTFVYNLCLEDGCYTFNMYDSFGDGWNGAWYLFTTGDELIAEGSMFTGDYQTALVSINADCGFAGCTDPEALNYNPAATIDNGSCLYEEDFDPFLMMMPDVEATIVPNPVVDLFQLQLKNISDENGVVVSIYDMTGRVVYENQENETQATMNIEMDASTLESGYYVINVVNGDQSKSVMLVKQY